MQEIQLSGKETADLQGFLAQGLTNLGATETMSPNQVVTLIDSTIDNWQDRERQSGQRAPKRMVDETALIWGVTWGHQIIRQCHWEWTKFEYEGTIYVVVASPQRDWSIHPWYFVTQCLTDPQMDCTILLAFQMLMEYKVPPGDAGTFEDLMPAVTRIVPKPGRRMSERLS